MFFFVHLFTRCNVAMSSTRPLKCLAHNSAAFDTKFLILALKSSSVRKHIEKIKILAKSNQEILDLQIQYRCFVCEPDLLEECMAFCVG